jgi:hypothetical protein
MFQPENELERSLIRATADPASQPEFLQRLLEAQVFIALVPSGGTITPGADGNAIIPAGTKLELRGVQRGGEEYLPFFSAPSRARLLFRGDHIVAPENPRDLFRKFPGRPFVLNPGSDYGKEFLPDEIRRLLQGDLRGDFREVVIDKPTSVLVSQPLPYPTEIVGVLAKIFAETPSVSSAHLAQVTFPDRGPELLIGIDGNRDWDAMMGELRPKLRAVLPPSRLINFTPLSGSSFEDDFRSGIPPFYARA